MPQIMGKASRWITNFLLGKKEEREKKREISFPLENLGTPTAILPGTPKPKAKRKWSFKKSPSADNIIVLHKRDNSFDSTFTTQVVPDQALFGHHDIEEKVCNKAILPVVNKPVKSDFVLPSILRPNRAVQEASAIRIQATFRSHLAKKALRALKSLVKLQALVRGHLVRKQTSAMLKCMQSLMAIQLRARVQRVQIADEATTFVIQKNSSQRKSNVENHQRRRSTEKADSHTEEAGGLFNTKVTQINYARLAANQENAFATSQSARLSISERRCQFPVCRSPSLTDVSSIAPYEKQLQVSSSGKARRSTGTFVKTKPKQEPSLVPSADPLIISQLAPNYMTNTESSRMKSRSQSEPRRRPKWSIKQNPRRTPSMDGLTDIIDTTKGHSSACTSDDHEYHYPWMPDHDQPANSVKYGDSDSHSTLANGSIH